MKSLVTKRLIMVLTMLSFVSCSKDDPVQKCPNWYYVYVSEDCECALGDDTCQRYRLLSKSHYDCLQEVLSNSTEPCIYVDETICNELNFEGYIKEVVADCLDYR